jgi:peroxiredoxin
MLAAAAAMLLLAACALVVGWWGLQRSEELASRGPGSPGSPVKLGQPAPAFEQYALDDSLHRLADYRGSLVALNFWATWCVPCKLEFPALNQASRAYRDQGLVVLAVNVKERPSMVIDFARRQGLEYPILSDPYGKVADLYGVTGMPVTVWIDAEGTVRRVDHGVLTGDRIASAVAEMSAAPDPTKSP